MMKSIRNFAAVLFLLVASAAQAQTIGVKAPRFVRPLVERWVAEYQKSNADFDARFVQGSQDSQLTLVLSEGQGNAYFGRYAIVPFTAKDSEAATLLAKKKLNNKRIKSVLFENEDLDDEKEDKDSKFHIYTGNNSLSTSRPYAAAYGFTVADYKGKRISGDDKFLVQAISQDPLGLGINALGNLYDLNTRQVAGNVQIAALDADKKDQLLSANTLDEVIQVLEDHAIEGIDIEKIGFTFDVNNPQLNRFVNWVLTDGQQYLHEYGLLVLSQKELAAQQRNIRLQDIAQK